jgi:hypothetical protein
VLQEDFVVCVFISPILNHQIVQRKPGCLKYKHVMNLMQTAESEVLRCSVAATLLYYIDELPDKMFYQSPINMKINRIQNTTVEEK